MKSYVSREEFDETAKRLFRQLGVWSGESLSRGNLDEGARRGAQARVRTGHIAALKRGLRAQGKPVASVAWVIEPQIPINWPTDSKEYEALYHAAMLYTLQPFNDPRSRQRIYSVSITSAFLRANGGRRNASDDETQANDRRINLILDAGRHEIFNRLRQVMPALLNKSSEEIHWVQLAHDLRDWEDPDQRVQQRWAREWFGGPAFMRRDVTVDEPVDPQSEDRPELVEA